MMTASGLLSRQTSSHHIHYDSLTIHVPRSLCKFCGDETVNSIDDETLPEMVERSRVSESRQRIDACCAVGPGW
jgi:hypothetical protein